MAVCIFFHQWRETNIGLLANQVSASNYSGTSDWTFHDFRRSMATALADAGVEQFAIKCAPNHKDNSVTGVYDKSYKDEKLRFDKGHSLIHEHKTQTIVESEQ